MTRRVLVPLDFSEFSDRALQVARDLSDESTELLLLHVYEPPRLSRPDLMIWGELDGEMMPLAKIVKEEAKEKLDALVEDLSPRTSARLRPLVEEGRASNTIIDVARREGCDMIVLGSHGRSGFKRLVLGSVAEAVVRGASCPVLTVPPSER